MDSGQIKDLQNIENGELNVQKKSRQEQNDISIRALNENTDHRKTNEENSLSSNRYEQNKIQIPISTEDSQSFNCNTINESICNGNRKTNNLNAYNGNGHAIIDVINTTTTHTNNDNTRITIKQLPYNSQSTNTQTKTLHANHQKNTEHNTNNDVDVNTSGPEDTNRKQQKLSNKVVVLLRRSKSIALVVINSLLAVLIATSLCISMGLDYTVPAIVVGLIAVVASSGLWYWLYIAAVTAPRDIRYVYSVFFGYFVKIISIIIDKNRDHEFHIMCSLC